MINAYGASPAMAGSSPKAQWWKDQWVQEKNCRSSYHVEVLDTLKLVPRRQPDAAASNVGAPHESFGVNVENAEEVSWQLQRSQ